MTEQRSAARAVLGALPLTLMSLAVFLVVFVLLMARLTAGADPALHASATAALVQQGGGTRSVRTRTSGGSSAGPTAPIASGRPGATSASAVGPSIRTRSSGSTGLAQVGDD